jgi:hypothetical protein
MWTPAKGNPTAPPTRSIVVADRIMKGFLIGGA